MLAHTLRGCQATPSALVNTSRYAAASTHTSIAGWYGGLLGQRSCLTKSRRGRQPSLSVQRARRRGLPCSDARRGPRTRHAWPTGSTCQAYPAAGTRGCRALMLRPPNLIRAVLMSARLFVCCGNQLPLAYGSVYGRADSLARHTRGLLAIWPRGRQVPFGNLSLAQSRGGAWHPRGRRPASPAPARGLRPCPMPSISCLARTQSPGRGRCGVGSPRIAQGRPILWLRTARMPLPKGQR